MLSPGDKVKDCEIIAPLGAGGMATLYLARRRGAGGFSRLVTLKLVHPHLIEDERVLALFLNEARICAQVTHPNVVRVEDVGEYQGSYFIAMEYVHGVTFAELLARLRDVGLRLRRKLCVWLAAQLLEGLHASHEATDEHGVALDIVHRDVSPQNVLISHTGHVKLIDFGIAKSQVEVGSRSRGQPLLGKLHYMAPEVLCQQRAGRRADVYALGVMLWEMLTGRSLLRCTSFDDERDWAIRENPPAPSHYAGHAPPALDRVVQTALACDPRDRYATAAQFRSALLRADPEALLIDAPMVASLMRALLGDELDRRRASWPSEIVAELDATPGITISRQWSLDELTDVSAPCAPEPGLDDTEHGAREGASDEPRLTRRTLHDRAPPETHHWEDEATVVLARVPPSQLRQPAPSLAAAHLRGSPAHDEPGFTAVRDRANAAWRQLLELRERGCARGQQLEIGIALQAALAAALRPLRRASITGRRHPGAPLHPGNLGTKRQASWLSSVRGTLRAALMQLGSRGSATRSDLLLLALGALCVVLGFALGSWQAPLRPRAPAPLPPPSAADTLEIGSTRGVLLPRTAEQGTLLGPPVSSAPASAELRRAELATSEKEARDRPQLAAAQGGAPAAAASERSLRDHARQTAPRTAKARSDPAASSGIRSAWRRRWQNRQAALRVTVVPSR